MGEVYKAQDTRVGRHVALKLLPESLASDTDRRRRFEQEARLAAALNHPNIMAIYDVGLDAHPPYIVAELVPGESLRAVIDRGPLPARRAADIAAQIGSGLAAAHAAGIVHRDLKPENIMIAPDGAVKILDFGVARMQTKAATADQTATIGQTAAGAVVGTAAYMSPEQARAEDVDYRSDQFSLGVVLYEMLSGRQAFARPSAVQSMSAIVEDDPPPIERPVPAQLRWILERCLAKERETRYESTRDLARELAQLRDRYTELTAATSSSQAAVARPRRRVPVHTVGVGLIAAAIIAWCAARLLTNPRAVDISQYQFTPFATALNEQFAPAWSPDGKSIAFLGRRSPSKLELFVQPANAPTAVVISGSDADVYQANGLFWSPDSRSIFYRCSFGGNQWGLCRIPASGGASALVQLHEIAGTISPDGQSLATFTYPEGKVLIQHPVGSAAQPYDPMPLKIESYYNSPWLSFSPDGRSIILGVALTGRGETSWLLPWPPARGRRVFPQTSDLHNTPQWRWLPDSRHMIFSEAAALYMADLASQTYWPVLAQDHSAGGPSISPDGSRIAYVPNLSHADLVAVPLGGGPVNDLLTSTRTYQMADVSPNGQQIVYVTNLRGAADVWISSLAEGWQRPLVSVGDVKLGGDSAQFLMTPVFSRDGRRVAVVAKMASGTRIFTVFTSGGTPVEATGDKHGFEMTPAWSPDGNWLVYRSLQGLKSKMMKVRPGSGEPPVELGEYSGSAVPAWSPTGEWIACHRSRDGKLVLVSPDGQTVRALGGDEGPVAWSRDGKKLYQVQMSAAALIEFDVASGQALKLRDLTDDLRPYSSMSPGLMAALTGDGKSLVYAVNRPRQEIWMLDGVQTPRPWYRRLLP